MAGKKRDKDHLKEHAGVELVETISPPSDGDDPLRWWTQHPDEAVEVDLYVFAEGQAENPFGKNSLARTWRGPFTGRPTLIRELAPVLKVRTQLTSGSAVENYLKSLRAWWRLFDALEATLLPGGRRLESVVSVADLNPVHEAGAHQAGMAKFAFDPFFSVADSARKVRGLPQLHWIGPDTVQPDRRLISDSMAKVLRIAMKRHWVAVRRTWALRDQVRAEADRRDQGELPVDLGPECERLLVNWREFQRAAQKTGQVLPASGDLLGGRSSSQLCRATLTLGDMRAIQFPTVWETDAAYHLALLDSGWNPTTMLYVDASDPHCVAPGLKEPTYLVLRADEINDAGDLVEEAPSLSMSAPKPRARGKLQTCHGLAKNTCSAPVIVQAVIQRTELLRAVLNEQLRDAMTEHARLQSAGADRAVLGKAFQRVQDLRHGVRSVWVYVDSKGEIRWLRKGNGSVRYKCADPSKRMISYLSRVIEQLAATGKTIGRVTPGDLRDLYARKFLRDSGGSVLALMLALNHSSVRTTADYLENNVFRAENDEVARRFLDQLFGQLAAGRVDLTILAQLSRHGPLSDAMAARLLEYRSLMKSRLGVGCRDPRNPPNAVDPDHVPGHYCTRHRCALCPHARFLPESLDGFAMRAEELMLISDLIPREAWLRLQFDAEQARIEALLEHVYPVADVTAAREKWRAKVQSSEHRIPGIRVPQAKAGETYEPQTF